jgi:hypothetical protein
MNGGVQLFFANSEKSENGYKETKHSNTVAWHGGSNQEPTFRKKKTF